MSSSLAYSLFDNPRTLLIVKKSFVDKLLPNAQRVVTFTSLSSIKASVDDGLLPAGTKYVLYDNERWALTPADEQRNPIASAEQARAFLHQHGLKLIFAPGVNLATVMAGTADNQKYTSYLAKALVANGVRASDVFEIQGQQLVGMPAFASFVAAAAGQAKSADPSVPVLLGLSTNPLGRTLTASALLDAYHSTRSLVSGYWLNVPAASAKCPTCGASRPQVAVSFLESLPAG
jgi:hypothetical protein